MPVDEESKYLQTDDDEDDDGYDSSGQSELSDNERR